MPDSPHAVSVSLPKWQDVIDYEEKIPAFHKNLKAIYPRFGLNPLVEEIAIKALKKHSLVGYSAWPYPNIESAQQAKRYCQSSTHNSSVFTSEILGLHCLLACPKTTKLAKQFWQHTGIGASSRLAAIALQREPLVCIETANNSRKILIERLARIYSCETKNIELHPSGMASLNRALQLLKMIHPSGKTLQVGFPYVDVLKLPQAIFNGGDLILNSDQKSLINQLKVNKPSAVIVELPSNPMLQCIELQKISELAHEHGVLVIADDTIGSSINIDALPYSDLVFSSLTKSFSGRGDILAGSLVISPYSPWEKKLSLALRSNSFSNLADPDVIALEEASRDVNQRLKQLNQTCLSLKHHLEKHKAVANVLHPEKCPNFQSLMRPEAGYGCLLSFELKGELKQVQNFYDSIKVCKGPSLGNNFTLLCPYVLLAHYEELDWAQKCGVPPYLLRVSVGLEEPEDLWSRFKIALDTSQ